MCSRFFLAIVLTSIILIYSFVYARDATVSRKRITELFFSILFYVSSYIYINIYSWRPWAHLFVVLLAFVRVSLVLLCHFVSILLFTNAKVLLALWYYGKLNLNLMKHKWISITTTYSSAFSFYFCTYILKKTLNKWILF